jgi:hypothetical protein
MGGMECERAFWNPIIFETGSSPVEFQSEGSRLIIQINIFVILHYTKIQKYFSI